MVKIMENPIKIHDLGGNTPIFGNTHIYENINWDIYVKHHVLCGLFLRCFWMPKRSRRDTQKQNLSKKKI